MLREGYQFRQFTTHLEHSQWWNANELASYQADKLRRILEIAYKRTPHYRDAWRGVAEKALQTSPEAFLKQLPYLDKAAIRAAERRLLATRPIRPLFVHHTSGTTGAPLTLYQDLPAIIRENAFIHRQLRWAGYEDGNRRAWFRGDMVVPTTIDEPPFWRRDSSSHMLMLSSYHLSLENAPLYLDALARFEPVIIQAYPSSIGFLAAYLDSVGRDYKGTSLKAIVTSSETLSEKQRLVIEKRFGCRVFDWYGQNERVAAIGTCERGSYHVISDYSYVELLPTTEGFHEVVGTCFNNFAMPLIRYRTGDLVEVDEQASCACGRAFPVIKRIHGRQSNFVKLKNGRSVASNCITMVFETGLDGIVESQIVQDNMDELIIKLVPGPNYTDALERQLIQDTSERLGHQIGIRVVRTDHIDRTTTGKRREVICNI